MKKLLNMKKKEKPIRTPKEKPKKEARMPKIKREKPKRQPKSKNQNPSVKKLPKPVSVVWEWLKWLGRQILKLIRIIPTLFPKKSEKDAPLLDGNVKVLPQFCIQTKLIGCYLIPVMLIVILGIVSYSRSSGALNDNYESAVSQTMNMANEYFTFALSNIESDMNTVLSDSELSTYYSGEYSTNDAQQKTRDDLKKKYDALQEKINSLTPGTTAYYKTYYDYARIKDEFKEADEILTDASDGKTNVYNSFNQSISNKVAANQFIGNIYIVKGGYNTFSSQSKLRGQEDKTKEDIEAKRDIHSKGEEIYSAFLDTDLGKKVSMDATSYYWVGSGSMPELDKLLLVEPSSYILRVAHDVSSTTDAVMIVDIKKDAILDILTNFNLGEGSYVGIITPDNQEMVVEGKDITKVPAHKIVSMGMAHVPEGRRVFAELSVYENLIMGAYTRKNKAEIQESLVGVYKRFPRLEERKGQRAGTLSGGEQQMLAMGRALMSKPRLIVMDEPSMGLSPIFVNEIFDIIRVVSEGGTTVLLVEQNAKKALSIADRAYVLETGKITMSGKASDLLNDEAVQKAYLGE